MYFFSQATLHSIVVYVQKYTDIHGSTMKFYSSPTIKTKYDHLKHLRTYKSKLGMKKMIVIGIYVTEIFLINYIATFLYNNPNFNRVLNCVATSPCDYQSSY